MPTLIINEYILTRFKEEHGPYMETGNEIYTIKRVTRRGVHRPIMDLQYQRLTSQIRDCHREETSYFELF